tara:strand:+ start:543 stop:1604 length:1062 start_codon:yes stop_codon:yes gene_type:complete
MDKFITAIDAVTQRPTRPAEAYIARKYYCPDCPVDDNKVILCGKESNKVKPYFRHHFKNKENPCRRYTSPPDQTIHNSAIDLLKFMLNEKDNIEIERKCMVYGNRCQMVESYSIDKPTIHSEIIKEYNFDAYYRADLAFNEGGKTKYIFEVWKTHKTQEEDRPSNIEWFDISADEILTCEKNENGIYIFNCCRKVFECEECLAYQEKLKKEYQEEQRIKHEIRLKELERENKLKEIMLLQKQEQERLDIIKFEEKKVKEEEKKKKAVEENKLWLDNYILQAKEWEEQEERIKKERLEKYKLQQEEIYKKNKEKEDRERERINNLSDEEKQEHFEILELIKQNEIDIKKGKFDY